MKGPIFNLTKERKRKKKGPKRREDRWKQGSIRDPAKNLRNRRKNRMVGKD